MAGTEYTNIGEQILEKLPVRKARSNKGTYGKVLCAAGSLNMAGAAYLCGYGAYRAGAGLVRLYTPKENRVILQELLPEAILTTFDREALDQSTLREALNWASVAAVGPGIGNEAWVSELMEQILSDFHKPLVIDADGLNAIAKHRERLKEHQGEIIVTPHVGEFSRLSGQPIDVILKDVPYWAYWFAKEYHCICVLKDAPSAVGAMDGTCYVNTTGNHGMSTGGSGDVLTGIITGLLGQKVAPLDAALLGVWLHGRAGDLAAQAEGAYGMMARHLIQYLPQAMTTENTTRR